MSEEQPPTEKRQLVLSSEEMLKQLRERAPDSSLLGTILWRGAVILLSAQTSAGKTILTHRMGRNLAAGEPFLGMTPDRPLRVLHIDLESPLGAKLDILETISPVPGWDMTPYITPQEARRLIQDGGYDLVIVDNLQTVYPVKDENDNAEAVRQMNDFATWAKETDACILLLHNTGKGHQEGVHMPRGASARVDRADTSINLTHGGGDERILKVEKSRFGNKGETISFKWAAHGYDFTLVKHDKIATGLQCRIELDILNALPEGQEVKREWIAARLGIVPGTSQERTFNRALKSLLNGQGILFQPRYGCYQKGGPSEQAGSR